MEPTKRYSLAAAKRYALLRQNGFTDNQAEELKYDKKYDVTGLRFDKEHNLIPITHRKYKLTTSDERKIRYQLYKDAGYSTAAARKLKYNNDIDLTGLRINKKNGKVVKSTAYSAVKGAVDVDRSVDVLRSVKNTSVFSRHGMLLHDSVYKGRYNNVVQNIRKRDNLTNDQAYYFAWFMLEHDMSYEQTRKELLSSRDFEIYVSKKHLPAKNKSSFVNPNKKPKMKFKSDFSAIKQTKTADKPKKFSIDFTKILKK